LTCAQASVIEPWVNIEQKVNDWVDVIVLRNAEGGDPWSARFLIEGFWPTVGAVEDLAPVGGAIMPDGRDQYVLTFPPSKTREVVELVAEQGGWLCERQTVVPE
jgi:hypothetical protein